MLPSLNECLTSADVHDKEILRIVSQHLKELAENFDDYFSKHEDPRPGNLWINDPNIEDVSAVTLISKKKKLIALCCDSTQQSKYNKESLSQFWIAFENEYPSLSLKAIKLLVVFSTSYLREKTFSSLTLIKTKQRNRLNAEATLRVSETFLQPLLSRVLASKQQQISQ